MAVISPLNPIAAHDPTKSLTENVFWKRVWNATLVISIVAFTALGVFAIAVTSSLWPAHLPIVSITILVGFLPSSSTLITKIWKKAEHYKKEADWDKKLKNRAQSISTEQLRISLNELGISSRASPSIVKPLLSRYRLLQNDRDYFLKKAIIPNRVKLLVNGEIIEVEPINCRMSHVNFDDPKKVAIFEAFQRYQLNCQKCHITAAIIHIKMAFILFLMQHPKDGRTFEGFVQLTTENPVSHLIAQKAGDPTAYTIATVNGKPYTADQLLAKPTSKLARGIFCLKSNWSLF